ncbi:hypothetical protein [Owenweeksia hongkongensis]|uniref:hypothetical protein n=1 Tax=Owenweeksia hongkongensis TaxID=253245 RepID=UPI003A93A2B1
MNNSMFFILVIACLLGIMIYNFFFSKRARINRKLKKAPSRKISEFKDGEVAKIVGEVFPIGEQLLAPLSKRECSYYYVLIEQKKSSGKNSYWRTIIENEVSHKFLIKEGEHYALINDTRVMSNIVIDKEYSSGLLNDATMQLESYLKKHNHESENFFGFNKQLRYKEGILETNERVSVLGQGQWKSAEELELPLEYGNILVLTAADDEHIYLSDNPETTQVNTVKPTRNRYNKRYRK